MTTNHESSDDVSTRNSSPLRDNWKAMLFMTLLLLASGVTASVFGYRVKMATLDRRAQLYHAYESLGGTRQILIDPRTTLTAPTRSAAANTFIVTYETNERSRSLGLYIDMQASSPATTSSAIAALKEIGATDASLVVANSWAAFQEIPSTFNPENPTAVPVNAKAARIAKKYDRYVARDVDAKLYKFLVENRAQIEPGT